MRRSTPKFLLALSAPLMFTACATIGPHPDVFVRGCERAVDVPGAPAEWPAAASVAGVGEAALGSAGYAQGRSRYFYLDGSERYDRSADDSKRGSNPHLPRTCQGVGAVRHSGG